jgi:arylsulfatase A-like enzyme
MPSSTKRIEKNGETVSFDGYLTDVFGQQAIEFLEDDSEEPFFLYLSFTAPHGPMHATEEDLKRFKNITDKKRRTYAAMIWAMDRAIGNVLDALDASGQTDNTIVWFLSDNGGATGNGSINLPLAGHKGIKFEGGIRVPFLMRWPERFSTGKVYDGLVSSMDIFATSLAAAGGNVTAAHLDGVDLVPFLTGKQKGPPHQQLFWHKLWFSAMRDDSWKLIYVKDYGYALYNMSTDREEKHNVATKHTERVESMKNQMNTWKAAMEQPRWDEAMRWFHVHYKNHVNIIEGTD